MSAVTTTAGPTDTERARRMPSALRVGLARARFEVRQFFREKDAVVFTFAFPIIFLVIFGSVFGDKIAPGVTFSQYFVAGMIASGVLTSSFQNLAIRVAEERDDGTLKRLAGTPMPRSAYFLGKIAVVLASMVGQVVIMLALGVLLFGVQLPSDPGRWLTFVWVSALGVTACSLLGIAYSSLARSARSAPAVVTPVVIVAQFLSGVFFEYDKLPSWMQQVAAVFPLKWMAQGMRSVFLPDSFQAREIAGTWEHGRVALVLAAWTVAGLVLCLRTFRWKGRDAG